MAEISARRVVALATVAAALVGGAVAAGVAAVAGSANQDTTAAQTRGGSVATPAVVRTDLSTTVQVGGSIAYDSSYTIAAPSGSAAQEVVTARQTVAGDRQTLSADERTESDTSASDDRTVATDRSAVSSASGALRSGRAARARDCAGRRSPTARCTQRRRAVSQDRSRLTQARQQLDAATSTATLDRDQNAAKVAADSAKLRADAATLASLRPTALSDGTAYTWLPKVGAIIRRDRPVYSVSDEPVPLLYGPIAAYRAFYLGMPDGADVGELTRELIALGDGAGLSRSDHYSSATRAAVWRWQRSLGLRVTGEILLGQVVFEPGPIRVTSVPVSVGSSVGGAGGASTSAGGGGGGGGSTVLTATGTTPVVSVDLDVSDEYLVKPGDAVSVVLPNGSSSIGGRIETVGNVATCPGGGSTGAGSTTGGSTADQSPCQSSGAGSSSTPTVTVTIRLDSAPLGARLDQAPVSVDITSQKTDHVLAVPVNALLALQGGGYGVDVVTRGGMRLVGVRTGLYSDTRVQVSGPGIAPGVRVEVPSS